MARQPPEDYFERWLELDEKRQASIDVRFSQQNEQINQLSRDVATLTADVRTLVENQRGLFSRTTPRPVNWVGIITAFVGAVSLWGSATWLLMIPVNANLESLGAFRIEVVTRRANEEYEQGQRDKEIEWLKTLEQRHYLEETLK